MIAKNSQSNYRKIYRSTLTLLHQLGPEVTYEVIAKEAKKLVKAKYVSIFQVEDGELKRMYASSPKLHNIKVRKKGYTYKTYSRQKPYILHAEEINKLHPEFKELAVQSDISIPLTYNAKTFGVLSVISKKYQTFTAHDLSVLLLFSPVASLALRNMQLYEELNTAIRERDLFISVAAHEFKTPLTTMSIYSDLLLQRKKKTLEFEEQIKESLKKEIGRLSRLVNEVLQVNQIKKGELPMKFALCNFVSIIEDTVFAFQNIYPSRSFVFSNLLKDEEAIISADRDKLSQVVINLLHNATKYSPQEKPIEITVLQKDDYFIATIKDYGKGISPKEMAKIFNRFYQVTNKNEGLGLGLYLAKNFIEHHGGQLKARSKVGQGTTFCIEIPSNKEHD